MDPTVIKALLDALTASPPDPDAIAAAAKAVLAALAGAAGDGAEGAGGEEASAEMAEPVPPKPGVAAPPAPPAKNPAPPVPPPAKSSLAKLTGAKDDAEAVANYKAMQLQVTALTAERNEEQAVARAELVGELVKLGAETPATAWEDADKKIPKKRFSTETLSELKTRVEALRASKPKSREIEAPRESEADAIAKLSKYEIAECKKQGIELSDYVVRKANAVKSGV